MTFSLAPPRPQAPAETPAGTYSVHPCGPSTQQAPVPKMQNLLGGQLGRRGGVGRMPRKLPAALGGALGEGAQPGTAEFGADHSLWWGLSCAL